jgi:hypothetical protein
MAPQRFLLAVLGFFSLFGMLVAAANIAIDPYMLFDRPRVPGFNAVKPAVETREAMMKRHQAARVTPRTVILGSSRSDIGLDPASSAWPTAMQPVYNLSTVGADLATNLVFLQRLLAHGRAHPKTVVVGLDFESFLLEPANPGNPGPAAPPEAADAGDPFGGARDYLASTLTLDALEDSMSTLWTNRRGLMSLDMQADGRLTDGHLRRWTAADGVALLFEQKNRLTVRRYQEPRHVLSHDPAVPVRDFAGLDALVALARAHQIEVVLLVQPAHASRLEMMDALGYWPDYELWKRELARWGARMRDLGARVTVWDFGGYESTTTEVVPTLGDKKTRLKWFWDPVHYSTALGDLLVTTMTATRDASAGTAAGDTGAYASQVPLSADNVQARLTQVRQDRERFRAAHASQVAAWRALACTGTPCGSPTVGR